MRQWRHCSVQRQDTRKDPGRILYCKMATLTAEYEEERRRTCWTWTRVQWPPNRWPLIDFTVSEHFRGEHAMFSNFVRFPYSWEANVALLPMRSHIRWSGDGMPNVLCFRSRLKHFRSAGHRGNHSGCCL